MAVHKRRSLISLIFKYWLFKKNKIADKAKYYCYSLEEAFATNWRVPTCKAKPLRLPEGYCSAVFHNSSVWWGFFMDRINELGLPGEFKYKTWQRGACWGWQVPYMWLIVIKNTVLLGQLLYCSHPTEDEPCKSWVWDNREQVIFQINQPVSQEENARSSHALGKREAPPAFWINGGFLELPLVKCILCNKIHLLL